MSTMFERRLPSSGRGAERQHERRNDCFSLSKVAPDTVARAKDGRIATGKLLTLEKLADALDLNVCQLFQHVKKE